MENTSTLLNVPENVVTQNVTQNHVAETTTTDDESSAETAPADVSIWESLSDSFKIDHRVQSSRVRAEIRKLVANQDRFHHILEAAAPYIYYIYKQTQSQRLPAELALIPVIESEFNPNDYSNKGAIGLWQLMPETARSFGIKIRPGYDGRRNIMSSTIAAMSYFKDLGRLYRDNWYLAIAAYNCGEGTVQSAIRRNGSRSFWDLGLPRDTMYYVPRLLAIAAIIQNPHKYGIELPHINNQPYFTELNISKPMPLTQVSKSLDVNIKTLHALNPDYKQGVVSNKKGKYTVLVPIKTVAVSKKKTLVASAKTTAVGSHSKAAQVTAAIATSAMAQAIAATHSAEKPVIAQKSTPIHTASSMHASKKPSKKKDSSSPALAAHQQERRQLAQALALHKRYS